MSESEQVEADDELCRTPAQRAFHAVLHGAGHMSHECDGSWLDDYGWDRIADALVATGWTPPEEDR